MATQVKTFKQERGRGRPTSYPWRKWMNGKWWKAQKGQDFHTNLESFRSLLHAAAKRNVIAVKTRLDGNLMYFKFQPRDEPEKQPAKRNSNGSRSSK